MKLIDLFDDIKMIVCNVYMNALKASPEENALFRKMKMLNLTGNRRLLMVVGAINQYYDSDNVCIVVLNPDKSLLREIHPGRFYRSSELYDIVCGKCDLALGLWTDARSGFSISPYFEYTSQPAPLQRFAYIGYGDMDVHE